MSIAAAGAAGLLGAGLGVGVSVQLRTGRYRLPGEAARLPPAAAWSVAPAVALVWAVLVAASTAPALVPAALIYALSGAAVCWIDLDVQRIPDPLLAVTAPLVAVAGWAGAAVQGQWWRVWTSLAAAAALTAGYLVVALLGSMGLGDVKLAAVTGLTLGLHGWSLVALATILAFAAAALTAVVLLARGAHRADPVAFGPAIILGAVIALTVGQP